MQSAGCFLLRKLKHFKVMLKIFEFSHAKVFKNHSIMFFDRDNETMVVPASLSYFLELLERKINFSLRSVIDIPVTIFKYYEEAN